MEKVLKYFHIPVHHAPFDTHLLSILYNEVYAYEWIAANFLHMQINTKDMVDNFYPRLLWNYCPFLSVYSVPNNWVRDKYRCFTHFLEEFIEKDFYVYAVINQKYIAEYSCQNAVDHNPIIFGIDSQNAKVCLADFFSMIYKHIECSYEEINLAFSQLSECKDYHWYKEIYLIHKEYKAEYNFNANHFIYELQKYRDGNNLLFENSLFDHEMSHENMQDYVFGLKCFDFAIEQENTIRILSMFKLHSYLWQKRINIFKQKGIFRVEDHIEQKVQKLQRLLDICLALRLKQKYSRANKTDIQGRMREMLVQCRCLEIEICDFFINAYPS